MRNLFSVRLNGRKSNYFCGESSYVSVLVVLFAILCLSVLPQALLYSLYCCVLMFRVCGNQHNKFIAKYKQESRPRNIWELVAFDYLQFFVSSLCRRVFFPFVIFSSAYSLFFIYLFIFFMRIRVLCGENICVQIIAWSVCK